MDGHVDADLNACVCDDDCLLRVLYPGNGAPYEVYSWPLLYGSPCWLPEQLVKGCSANGSKFARGEELGEEESDDDDDDMLE